MWVNEYLMEENGKAAVLAIIADIDCWQVIQWAPSTCNSGSWLCLQLVQNFGCTCLLQWFLDGHNFMQWTGDEGPYYHPLALLKSN